MLRVSLLEIRPVVTFWKISFADQGRVLLARAAFNAHCVCKTVTRK
jgi:hypothetical protein